MDNQISGTFDEILLEISGLTCNENIENVNLIEYDWSLNTRFIKWFRKKVAFISFCENEEDDNTCGIPSIRDPNGDIEIVVVNVGSETSNNDQFSCLAKGGFNRWKLFWISN